MFQYYYQPRWLFYFDYLRTLLAKNQTYFDQKKFQQELFLKIELPFIKATGQNLIQKANGKSALIYCLSLIIFI